MKRILFLLLIGLTNNLIFAQDIIVKQNGDEIKSKILEITSETIKYKEFDFQDGPTRDINISDVFMVIYENGKREKFTTTTNKQTKEDADLNNEHSKREKYTTTTRQQTKEDADLNHKFKGNYFMIGTGYGNSYGGLGIKIQRRMGGKQGFGIHVGVGYFPNAPILASLGLKFFPYKNFYLDTQFGLTGYEESYYYDPNNSFDNSHLLYGPSFLVGGDWVWGSKVGFGFNTGLGITYNINAEIISPITLALDLGFIIRF